MSDIVERLRAYQAYCPQTDRSDHPICTEAADAITTLRDENERMRALLESVDELAMQFAIQAMIERIGPPVGTPEYIAKHSARMFKQRNDAAEGHARAAISAYLAALKERVKP